MTNTMTLGKSKNKLSQIVGTSFFLKLKDTYLFSVVATKHVEIVLNKSIYNNKKRLIKTM